MKQIIKTIALSFLTLGIILVSCDIPAKAAEADTIYAGEENERFFISNQSGDFHDGVAWLEYTDRESKNEYVGLINKEGEQLLKFEHKSGDNDAAF